MARNLKTGWVIVATSGTTVDGRVIEKDWLKDMAKHYNPSLYAAKLWPDHYRFMQNGGSVVALKTQPAIDPDLEGELQLLAILAPNDWLIEANRQGQYVHASIEVTEDFMGKGHFYLGGIGVTDAPASVGTSELRFNKNSTSQDTHIFASAEINTCASLNAEPGLFARLFDNTPTQQEDDTMKPEQFESLKNELGESLKAQFKTLAESLTPTEPQSQEFKAEFESLKDENAALKLRVEGLEQQFSALENTPAGSTQAPQGEGDAGAVEVI